MRFASHTTLSPGREFWPLQAAAAIFADIVAEAGTVLTLVVYLSIMRALE